MWCQQSRGRGSGGLVSPAPVICGPPGGLQLALFLLFALANVQELELNYSLLSTFLPRSSPVPSKKMKTTPASAAKALDRLRGLARAAWWSRLQRDDLGDEANAAAQREYAQAREDPHDYGVSVEISEDATCPSYTRKRSRRTTIRKCWSSPLMASASPVIAFWRGASAAARHGEHSIQQLKVWRQNG